MQFFNMISY